MLGVDAKVKQYAVGAAFTRHVVDDVGMAGFNKIFSSPLTLPRLEELGRPAERAGDVADGVARPQRA